MSDRNSYVIPHFFLDPVPVKLYGEGNYAINDVYEVQDTEDYLGLNHGCNANQNREECETAKYLENIQSQCNCTPITYKSFFPNEVSFI